MAEEKDKDLGTEIPIEEETAEEMAEDAAAAAEGMAEDAGFEAGAEAEATDEAAGESTDQAASEADASAGSSDEDDPWQTKYMRLMADFQNYKKRTAKEVSDIRSSASEKVMTKILDVLDNFERAFEQGTTDEKYAEGIENIFKQLINVLGESGLAEMNVLGEDFDPNFHNAAVMEETDEYDSGKISGVIQKGYTLNGKVIRPPMVKVSK